MERIYIAVKYKNSAKTRRISIPSIVIKVETGNNQDHALTYPIKIERFAANDVRKFIGTRRPSKTFPAGKRPWALIFSWRVKPFPDRDSLELKVVKGILPLPIPTFHLFWSKHFLRFDTNSRVDDSAPPPLKKIVRVCPEDGYVQVKYR